MTIKDQDINKNIFEFIVTEEIVKRILSSISPKERFESAQEKIDKIMIDVANFFSIKKIDALRFFESTLGMEPFIWFQTKMKKTHEKLMQDRKKLEETTTSGGIASISSGFDPYGEWRSIYPVKKIKLHKKENPDKGKGIKKKIIKNKL